MKAISTSHVLCYIERKMMNCCILQKYKMMNKKTKFIKNAFKIFVYARKLKKLNKVYKRPIILKSHFQRCICQACIYRLLSTTLMDFV